MLETTLYMGGGDGSIFVLNLSLSAINANKITASIMSKKVHPITDMPTEGADGSLVSFVGHNKTVTALAMSPDGTTILSGGEDGVIKIWDCHSRRLLRSFTNHTGAITSVTLVATPPTLKNVGSIITSSMAPLAPIAPFKKFQSMANGVPAGVPIVIKRDSLRTNSIGKQKQTGAKRKLPPSDVSVGNSSALVESDATKEIEQLKQQVSDLTESNARWEALNEKLLSLASKSNKSKTESDPVTKKKHK